MIKTDEPKDKRRRTRGRSKAEERK